VSVIYINSYQFAAPAGPTDPYFANVSLLLHGDGTNGSTNIVDSSYNPKTITVAGNAQISTTQSKFGGSSIYFDGSGDYLNIGYNGGAFDFGSSDWTVEFWIYLPSLPNAYKRIYSYINGNTEACFFELTNSNKMSFGVYFDPAPSGYIATDPSAMTSGAWMHFAGVRNGSSLLLFREGIQVASVTVGTNSVNGGSGHELFIGKWKSTDTTRDLNAHIDDLRITRGIARYTSNFTPPTQPFPNF